jgi:hypothetical protein
VRKFIRHIALFALPFVGLLVWLLASTPPKDYTYNRVLKDCRSGMWMHRRMYASPSPVDVAFIGTSKTMCDINDSLLQWTLLDKYHLPLEVANFGVCRTGENLHYLITRDLLAAKQPPLVVVEVGSVLHNNSHFHFPHVGTTGDVLGAPMWANSDYLGDIVQLTWNRLVYQRETALGIQRTFKDIMQDSLHSFMRVKKDAIADSTEMARVKAKRQRQVTDQIPTGIAGWVYQAETTPTKYYFQQIAQLCAAYHSQIVFLYLPAYGEAATAPQEKAFFETMGPVWIPPDSIFHNPKLHFDNSHLNMQGAATLNTWLAKKVAEMVAK